MMSNIFEAGWFRIRFPSGSKLAALILLIANQIKSKTLHYGSLWEIRCLANPIPQLPLLFIYLYVYLFWGGWGVYSNEQCECDDEDALHGRHVEMENLIV